MSAVTVRPSEPADFAAWFALFEEVAGEGKWIGAEAPIAAEYFRDSFDASHEKHRARFVAEIDGVIVGEIGIENHRGVAELGMMVRDGYRGQGVGSALMQACIDWCRTDGAFKITLQMWPHNAAALALYRKFDFHVEGRFVRQWRRKSGELWDAITMGLVLDTESPGSPHPDARRL